MGIGLSSFCNSLVLAFVAGIGPAIQGLVARRSGERSSEAKCVPLNAGLATAFILGAPLSMLGYLLTPHVFGLVSSDPAVTRVGVPFLRILCLAILAVGINNAFRGHWTGIEKPRVYMRVVLFMNCLNVCINYVLIFGHFGAPALGATGAAIGTAISLYVGVLVNCAMVLIHFPEEGFLRTLPASSLITRVAKMGVPATMQEFFFSAGYIVFLWMVGQVGTTELAAANVLVRVTMVLVIFAISLGMASATLVSKTIGQGDIAGAAQWGWDVGKIGVISVTLLGLPLFLFPKVFLSIFLIDPNAVASATIPLQMVAATTGMGSLIYIFSYTMYSIGYGQRVMMVSFITQWFIFLPAVWVIGPHLRYGLLQIWFAQMVYGVVATALITAIWMGGKWKAIRI